MLELLRAHLWRVRKGKLFWGEAAAAALLSLAVVLNGCRQAGQMAQYGYTVTLDGYYFALAPALALFSAVFTSLFIGAQHAEGTIRNQLVVGHTRGQVYWAQFLTCTLACWAFVLAWLAAGLAGMPVLGGLSMPPAQAAVHVLAALLSTMALTAVFTLTTMLSAQRKAGAAVGALLLALALLLAAVLLSSALQEPEMIQAVELTAGGMQMGQPVPNPRYVTGGRRALYQFLLDALPTGQSLQIAQGGLAHPGRSLAASVVIGLGATAAGQLSFGRKDLK